MVFVQTDDPGHQPQPFEGRRFCEPGVSEPLKGDNQKAVSFFYHNGIDFIPDPPFTLPKADSEAPGSWQNEIYISNSCNDNTAPLGGDWGADLLCALSKGLTNGTIDKDAFTAAEPGDTVAVTNGNAVLLGSDVGYAKLFHPNTKANLAVAQVIFAQLRVI